MNARHVRYLLITLGINGALLVATAIATSGLFFPARLPVISRLLLDLGALISSGVVVLLWRKARRHSDNQR